MNSTEIFIAILSIALIWGAIVGWKDWLDHALKIHESNIASDSEAARLQTQVTMSDLEMGKMALLKEYIKEQENE